jgi:hypothetical protein
MEGLESAAVLEAPATQETPAVEAPAVEQETGDTAERVAGTPEKTPEQTEKDKLDRRNNPDALRKTLKWLRENGGEHSEQAKAIENALGETKSYKATFPTVREAREAKATLDAVGGAAKIAELQQHVTRSREIDELIEAGDPRAIDAVLEIGSKGLAKLLPSLIEKLSTTESAAVQAALQPHVFTYLDEQGMPEAIDAMVAAFNSGKPDDAKAVLSKIVNWWKQSSAGHAEAPQKAPEQAAWEKEREDFKQTQFKTEVGNAFNACITHAELAIDKELAPELKKYGIPAETAQLIRNDVWNRITRERNADELFKAGLAERVNERSRKIDATTADFLKAQTEARVKEAVAKEIKLRYGFIKRPGTENAPAVKPNPTAAPAGAVIEIDHNMTIKQTGSRSAAQDAILQGRAWNSAGKEIRRTGRVWKLA